MARGQQQSASVTVAFRAEQPPLDRCWFCPRCSDLATVCVCVCVCVGGGWQGVLGLHSSSPDPRASHRRVPSLLYRPAWGEAPDRG